MVEGFQNMDVSLELIGALSKTETVEDIHAICAEWCRQFGFDHFLYGARIPTSFTKPHYIYISAYPSEWRDRYSENGYMSIDPTVTHCASHITPLVWDKLKPLEKEDESIQRFMGEAREYGLNNGISLPVHTANGDFAMFNLSSMDKSSDVKKRILHAVPHTQLFTAYLHETVRRIFDNEILPLSQIRLSKREKECLLWTADGKTAWEIAKILSVAERTVVFHMQNSAEKLKVVNRAQAVARAVTLGLISPQLD